MKPIIYFRRGGWANSEEYDAACQYFDVVPIRTQIPPGRLVIPRYSMLPFPEEIDADVKQLGGCLINTLEEHRWVADIREYVGTLEGITPRTWTTWVDLPHQGSYIVKGTTNSKKWQWATRMFAPNWFDVPRVAARLMEDDFITSQGLVVREYIPLRKLGEGINGIPITNEWRFFVLDGQIVAEGYYWANEPDCCPGDPLQPPSGARQMAVEAIGRIQPFIRFYVVDVAERENGDWIVIELNDGCQSGPSMIPPDLLYRNLANLLRS